MRYLDDSDYASENATRNIVKWHKEAEEGGIWLDMGNENERRRIHMNPYTSRIIRIRLGHFRCF